VRSGDDLSCVPSSRAPVTEPNGTLAGACNIFNTACSWVVQPTPAADGHQYVIHIIVTSADLCSSSPSPSLPSNPRSPLLSSRCRWTKSFGPGITRTRSSSPASFTPLHRSSKYPLAMGALSIYDGPDSASPVLYSSSTTLETRTTPGEYWTSGPVTAIVFGPKFQTDTVLLTYALVDGLHGTKEREGAAEWQELRMMACGAFSPVIPPFFPVAHKKRGIVLFLSWRVQTFHSEYA